MEPVILRPKLYRLMHVATGEQIHLGDFVTTLLGHVFRVEIISPQNNQVICTSESGVEMLTFCAEHIGAYFMEVVPLRRPLTRV